MKNLTILSAVLIVFAVSQAGFGQSPYYSINVSLFPDILGDELTIIQRICEPKEWSTGNDWFSKDSSLINWKNISESELMEFECSELINQADGYPDYKYGNQRMVYENIVNLQIISKSLIDGNIDTMRIVFPIIKKSFITFIDLHQAINFREGLYDISDGLIYEYDGHQLTIKLQDMYEWKRTERVFCGGSKLIISLYFCLAAKVPKRPGLMEIC